MFLIKLRETAFAFCARCVSGKPSANMGIFASRSGVVTEDVTAESSNINPLMYRYPPKQGNYFSNYFIMGGERFDVQQPESYLFGDNSDLNFLGNRPVPVYYY